MVRKRPRHRDSEKFRPAQGLAASLAAGWLPWIDRSMATHGGEEAPDAGYEAAGIHHAARRGDSDGMAAASRCPSVGQAASRCVAFIGRANGLLGLHPILPARHARLRLR